jgi:Rieske Fe-S protein
MTHKTDRRTFIGTTAAIAAVTTLAPTLGHTAAKEVIADLGKIDDLDSGEPILVNATFRDKDGKKVDEEKVYVRGIKSGSGTCTWVVLSAICSHLKCKIDYNKSKNNFLCPCHKSEFDLDGNVLKKPAKKDLKDFSDEVSEEDGRLLWRRT